MSITEEEARARVCPFKFPQERYTLGPEAKDPPPIPPNFYIGGLCVASPCMLWRWDQSSEYAINRHQGFCGAGMPPVKSFTD